MKVLRKGKGNLPWEKKCVCGYCNAKLLVQKEDLFKVAEVTGGSEHDKCEKYKAVFTCPECYSIVKVEDFPEKMLDFIIEIRKA